MADAASINSRRWLPDESSAAGIRALLEAAARSHAASFLSVLKTMGREGRGIYLSFARPGTTLALGLPRGVAAPMRCLPHSSG